MDHLSKIAKKILPVLGGAAILVSLAWSPLTIARTTAEQGEEVSDSPVWIDLPGRANSGVANNAAKFQGNGLDVGLMVETGLLNNSAVLNGGTITYTIIVTNSSGSPLNNVIIQNQLPTNALDNKVDNDNIQVTGGCSGSCEFIINPVTFLDDEGVAVTIEFIEAIKWTIPQLGPNSHINLTFSGKVECQTDGSSMTDSVFVSASQGGDSASVETTIRVAPEKLGQASRSGGPTWCSTAEPGSTQDLDWGDFDGDGDLDLALANLAAGVVVYRNNGGQLERFWSPNSITPTFGVSWADLTNDGRVELVTVAKDTDADTTSNTQHIYQYNGGIALAPFKTFTTINITSTNAITVGDPFRVKPADYDGDGDLDLAVTYGNSVDPAQNERPCDVALYRNDQQATGTMVYDSCVVAGTRRSRIIAWGDVNNDGDPDLAVGSRNPDSTRVYINNGGVLTQATTSDYVEVDTSVQAFGLAWGDYDGDGYLDLAASYPGKFEVRVYPSDGAGDFKPFISIPSVARAVEWGNFDGDGQLELAVGEDRPKIYEYNGNPAAPAFNELIALPGGFFGNGNDIWTMRATDVDSDGDLDLAMGNRRDGESLLFTMFSPHLTTGLAATTSLFGANSVSWGDVNQDTFLDLLFGSAQGVFGGSRLLLNNQLGGWGQETQFNNGFGPQSGFLADMNGDQAVDVLFGTPAQNQLFLAKPGSLPLFETSFPNWNSSDVRLSRAVASGDIDDDGDLDLVAGNGGESNALYLNQGGQLSPQPAWESAEKDDTYSIALIDFDADFYLDLAVGNFGQPNRVYRNNKDNTFSLVWSAQDSFNTTSLAWGDYDNDGDMDLAFGNRGQPNYVYEKTGQTTWTPVWSSTETVNTTAVAWGDWDNDGDLDLAAGNEGQPDQVYANGGSQPGSPQLLLQWQASQSYLTTGLAWGDFDNDGDLDLAMSQSGSNVANGVYLNTSIMPSHLTATPVPATMPLPNNPAYVSLAGQRPYISKANIAAAAYFFSSPQILLASTITVPYRLYDPDNSRATSAANDAAGDDVANIKFEYSLNGGGTWQPASPAGASPGLDKRTSRQGRSNLFVWDAVKDKAVSDNARFRVTVFDHIGRAVSGSQVISRSGDYRRGAVSAVSPPFRVRALTCEWPANPSILVSPSAPALGATVLFSGFVTAGEGSLVFTWDFGDGSPLQVGEVNMPHIYTQNGTYLVTLTVKGPACPVAKDVVAKVTVKAGTGQADIYLPLVLKSSGPNQVTGVDSGGLLLPTAFGPGAPEQIAALSGAVQPDGIWLEWPAGTPAEAVDGYRLYRAGREERSFRRVAELPAGTTGYLDRTTRCGAIYVVTAYNEAGESLVSQQSYYSPRCQ